LSYVHAYIHAYIHTHIRTYIHTYICTYIHACMRTCMHTYIHTCMHTYIHTCIHTYIHTSDILCIQEPYTIQNKVVGIPNKFRTYTLAGTRSRTAIVVTNKHIDVLLLKQHSDTDAIVTEITVYGVKLIMASMYFDIGRPIEEDLSKIEAVLQHANGVGVLLAIDSNARSASWHDSTTNARGKTLDEYLMSKQLYI